MVVYTGMPKRIQVSLYAPFCEAEANKPALQFSKRNSCLPEVFSFWQILMQALLWNVWILIFLLTRIFQIWSQWSSHNKISWNWQKPANADFRNTPKKQKISVFPIVFATLQLHISLEPIDPISIWGLS